MVLEANVKRETGSGFGRLRIQTEPSGFVMIYMDPRGHYLDDTWHPSLEDAKARARSEFEIEDQDWVQLLP
jgi:hypothetical protein